MKVVRIEHPETGYGLFRHASYISPELDKKFDEEFNELLERHTCFPNPFVENLNMYKGLKKWFCAFHSIEQLQEWITGKELKRLINKWGFKIMFLEVSKFQIGTFQTIYTKGSIIESTDITELFNK